MLELLPAGDFFFVGQRRFVVRVWVAALVAAVIVDVVSGGAIRDRIASTIGDWVLEQRVALTFAGAVMFLAHPFVGVGPGGFASSLEQYGPSVTWLWDYLPTAQNAYVQIAAEAGILGLFGLLVFLGGALRAQLREARRLRADLGFATDESLTLRHLAAHVSAAQYTTLRDAHEAHLRAVVEADVR